MMASSVKARFARIALALAVGFSVQAHAAEPADPVVTPSTGQEGRVSPVLVEFQKAFSANGANLSQHDAVARLDEILVRQYGARGTIASENSPALKSLYEFAAALLMNGHPIAGGTVLSFARSHGDFSRSGVGTAYASFVDAMLSPTDEDEEGLAELARRASDAIVRLSALPVEMQLAAQVRVLGKIYGDDVAEKAGIAVLGRAPLTGPQLGLIESAWE